MKKAPILNYEDSYLATACGKIISRRTGRPMSPFKDCHGYLRITLCREGRKRNHYVHKLVYEAFHGAVPEGLEIDHKDNTKDNPCLDNFRLLTRKDNMRKVHDLSYRIRMSR